MGQQISGPGVGLVLPQNLYPSALLNAPIDAGTNRIGLSPGEELPIPAGNWYVHLGQYCTLEYLDPVTGIWTLGQTGAWQGGTMFIKSDGFTVRMANRTGCPLTASVTAPGNGSYLQASTTVTATGGTSTWQPIIGGQFTLASVTSAGAGYGIAPLCIIPAPPAGANNPNGVGGVPATAFATIASGTVSTISFSNPGAGYPGPVTITLLPNPTDPNLSTGITMGTAVFTAGGAGSLTAVLCTNPGVAISPAAITLTVAGAGSGATCVPNVLQTVTAGTITGTIVGAFGTVAALLTTTGGAPATGTFTNSPEFNFLAFRPRPAQINFTVTGAGQASSLGPQVGAVIDGGLFLSTPNPVMAVNPFVASGAVGGSVVNTGTLALVMGSRQDFVGIQPAP